MRGVFDSAEITQLEEELRFFKRVFSATTLMLADEKGKVRITMPTLNQVETIEELSWEQNAAGAYIISVTMPSEKPKPKPKAKAKKK